jgi:hypothetical protein
MMADRSGRRCEIPFVTGIFLPNFFQGEVQAVDHNRGKTCIQIQKEFEGRPDQLTSNMVYDKIEISLNRQDRNRDIHGMDNSQHVLIQSRRLSREMKNTKKSHRGDEIEQ